VSPVGSKHNAAAILYAPLHCMHPSTMVAADEHPCGQTSRCRGVGEQAQQGARAARQKDADRWAGPSGARACCGPRRWAAQCSPSSALSETAHCVRTHQGMHSAGTGTPLHPSSQSVRRQSAGTPRKQPKPTSSEITEPTLSGRHRRTVAHTVVRMAALAGAREHSPTVTMTAVAQIQECDSLSGLDDFPVC
jgi:hypothetical protein